MECIRKEGQNRVTAYVKYGCRCAECTEANNKACHDWSSKNPEKRKHNSNSHWSRKQNYVQSIKMERGCRVCGYNKNPRALCFHHRDAKDKTTLNITNLSWAKIDEEIAHCDVLCANCHSELHYPIIGE